MKIVVATDSFKGCLSSAKAGEAIKNGILKERPDAEVKVFPISDGGEGILEALKDHFDTEMIAVEVTGPQFEKVRAQYGFNPEKKLAVIEMAAAAGLTLVKGKKDPKAATTYGVGELILDALKRGTEEFIIGIGGSATNDGGIGMLNALGFGFYDMNGKCVTPNANGLKDLASIDLAGAAGPLKDCRFTVVCDVDIPLCGEQGCSAIFAPQKGADPDDIRQMDGWLSAYAKKTRELIPGSDMDFPGSGAAGGMGFALRSYLGADLRPGIDIVISCLGLEDEIRDADCVVTGEGRIDSQTSKGKVISGIVRTAKRYGKPVVAFCGSVADDVCIEGIDRICPVTPKNMPLEEAMQPETAAANLAAAASVNFKPRETDR
ncbi:MAG: glycerate kinase [Lachnospiraceae bacterium]|nr:glycerate kinase [Lachnospiraceae bacterium]